MQKFTEKAFTEQQFSRADVEVIATHPRYQGFLSTTAYELRHRLFAGGWSPVIQRELMERGHAVVVLPYDPKREELILLEQFRVGAMATSDTPWLLEFVAGMVDAKDADLAAVAARELQEEAGLTAQRLHYALSYLSSPGGMSERIYVYVAEVDSASASEFGGVEDEHEDIRVHRISVDQAMTLLAEGRIDNAASVIALQWFALNKAQLFADVNVATTP